MAIDLSAFEDPQPKVASADLERIIRPAEMIKLLSISKANLYRMIADGLFPKPIQIGKRANGWPESDYRKWLEQRIAER